MLAELFSELDLAGVEGVFADSLLPLAGDDEDSALPDVSDLVESEADDSDLADSVLPVSALAAASPLGFFA